MGVVMGDDDRQQDNPLTAVAEEAWLRFANGTYSKSDQRIFTAGFMAGRKHYRQLLEKQERYEQEYEQQYGSRRDCY